MEITPTEVAEAEPQAPAVKVTLYLDVDLRDWFRGHCYERGIAQSRLMAVLLRRYREEL